MSTSEIFLHSFSQDESSIQIKKVSHQNKYDYTKIHRHNYFEIIFFMTGGGKQLVDFKEYEIKNNSCYLISPNQIHLLNRDINSNGFILQFISSTIAESKLQNLLQERSWKNNGAIIFEENQELILKFKNLIELLNTEIEIRNEKERRYHLLNFILYSLLPIYSNESLISSSTEFQQFIKLLHSHFKQEHSVKFYSNELNINVKKLGALTKKHIGLTPLQTIHQRILLEAKRELVFAEKSHKEIGFDLGFDSPSSFSAFIKSKTNKTASELELELAREDSQQKDLNS